MAKINIGNLAEFDSAALLTSRDTHSEVAIAAYLTDIIQANDAGLLADALGTIARARGMTEVASGGRYWPNSSL